MKRSYRDNKPRYHKHRQGKMLLPHNQLSGLFFTVNPRQEPRAQREAQLYLSTLTRDLEAAHEAFALSSNTAPAVGDGESVAIDNGSSEDAAAVPAPPPAVVPSASLSSLLAAELAACGTQDQRGNRYNIAKRSRVESDAEGSDREDSDSDADDRKDGQPPARKRRDAPQRRREWFAPLETGCKGYLFLNVPIINAKVTCPTCHVPASNTAASQSEGEASSTVPATSTVADGDNATPSSAMAPHTIVLNPLVSRITERIFDDLDANPRPIFRNCFRLMPAELTCCPTLPEMQAALRELLALHFSPATTTGTVVSAADAVDFTQPISLPSWGSVQQRRSMHTIALQLTVKNNTNVEQKKASILSALTAAIPANRFIVVGQPSSKTKCIVEATLCIFVAHATCVMGLQRRVTERRGFNLHAVGEEAFVLSNSVHAAPRKGEEPVHEE